MSKNDDHDRDSSGDPFLIHETITFCIALIFSLYLLQRCGL